MNIALLGGAFNPPHIGHEFIIRQVLDYSGVDEAWLLPIYRHSFEKPMAPVKHRLAMSKLLENDRVHVSTIEIDNTLSGETIEILPFLPKEHAYRFVIGSDQLPSFHLWGKWQELLVRLPFLVFPRYGYPSSPLYEGMTVVSHKLIISSNASSTKIRERVRAGLSPMPFVRESVAKYIRDHDLYT